MSEFQRILSDIKNPERLYHKDETLLYRQKLPFTKNKGLYAWYFTKIPYADMPTEKCHTVNRGNQIYTLLYVGIAPSLVKGSPSKQTLRKRIRTHYKGNIYGSTLRRSLASLLGEKLSLTFYRSGKRNRLRLKDNGEARLSRWMQENAFVTWSYISNPWEYERKVIERLDLPLNLRHNQNHPFYETLSKKRNKRV